MSTNSGCAYELKELPAGVQPMTADNDTDTSVLKWSGAFPIPPIGSRVAINLNRLGPGEVTSYFYEDGYLGLIVRLDIDPKWHKQRTKGSRFEGHALVFGIEITPESQSVGA